MQLATIRPTGLGELSIAAQCDDILVAQGLGSCVGIAAYDPARKLALLAHVMLPGPMTDRLSPDQPARFASQAVSAIVAEATRRGGRPGTLVIRIAGGAQVITIPGMEDRLKIGARNVEAVRAALAQHGLRIAAEDTGGRIGRTVSLYTATGVTTVRVVGGVEHAL